jgi:hypothetical protein
MVPLVSSPSGTIGGRRGIDSSDSGAVGDVTTVFSEALHFDPESRELPCLGGVTSSHVGSDSTGLEDGGGSDSRASLAVESGVT